MTHGFVTEGRGQGDAMPSYPEHDKLRPVKDKSQAIGEFLEWASDRGWYLAEHVNGSYHLYAVAYSIQTVLADYFEIDLNRLDDEKRAMLDEIRSANVQAIEQDCPGEAEYGRGFSHTTVHGKCCAATRQMDVKGREE